MCMLPPPTEETALDELEPFKDKWVAKYPKIQSDEIQNCIPDGRQPVKNAASGNNG